ncbi:MAG: EamA family transporter [Lutibacter sp.]|uniref:DMT family transporter n=1 Tax=Lutibacter sp. TaxID=1925666 RepID=UPI0019E97C84|nr:EamA family transporter [Lutibacter sp.]NOR28741.1 EamA family transporter [Lutibacter sp.]
MENKYLRWVYLFTLSIVWGSSFILMKRALVGLTPIQVGALRILITAIFLIPFGIKSLIKIKRKHWYYLAISGLIGSFFPAFLFAYAVEKIDSSIASILNSLTPLNTLIFGILFFGFGFRKRQLFGVLIGLIGTILLILKGAELNPNQDYFYATFILVASVGYAFNVNILKKHLHDLDAFSITVGNFVLLIIPTFIVLWYTNFFETFEVTETSINGILYLTVLAVFGTGLAKIMFNRLIQISNPIFSSSVTYTIPIVAITWGILDGEKVTLMQFASGLIILFGVYLVNRSK